MVTKWDVFITVFICCIIIRKIRLSVQVATWLYLCDTATRCRTLSVAFLVAAIALTVKQTGPTIVFCWRTSLFYVHGSTRSEEATCHWRATPGFAVTTFSTRAAVNWGQASFLHRSCRRLQPARCHQRKENHLRLVPWTKVSNHSKMMQTLAYRPFRHPWYSFVDAFGKVKFYMSRTILSDGGYEEGYFDQREAWDYRQHW